MLANIAVLASVYVLLAAGYVLIYRASRVLNFAHGDVFMVSGYLGFSIVAALALDPYTAFPIALGLGALAGVILYLLLMGPMAGHSVFAAVLVTIGLGILIRGFSVLGFKGQIMYPGRALGIVDRPVQMFGGALSVIDVWVIASAAVVMVALSLLLQYSRIGIQMRAAAIDARLAAQRGINIHLVFSIAWAIATGIAMYAGTLYSFNQQVSPALTDIGLRALAVALVGGMDSMRGIVPAAILVAALEILAHQYFGSKTSEVIPFVLIAAILLLRPWGLFGTKEIIDRV